VDGPGTIIGRYRLLEKLGEGGFGAVYVAEQKEPVQRQVALKILKHGMDTQAVVARFEGERQALAMMASVSAGTIIGWCVLAAGIGQVPIIVAGLRTARVLPQTGLLLLLLGLPSGLLLFLG